MEINGINIRDIKDVQDALTAFSTLNAELENLDDSMTENINDYQSLTTNQKEILAAINSLQINSTKIKDDLVEFGNDLPTFINQLNDKMKSSSSRVIQQTEQSLDEAKISINNDFQRLKNKINDLESTNLKAIEKAIDSVNFTQVEKAINNQIARQQKKLNSNISTLDSSIDSINESSKNLKQIQKNINVSISNFNKVSRTLTAWKTVAVLTVGAVFGAAIMLVYGLSEARPFYYQNLIRTKQEYKQAIQQSQGVAHFFNINNIKYSYGYVEKHKIKYFDFGKKSYMNSWVTKDGDLLIKLK